jgi:hypothetical protein
MFQNINGVQIREYDETKSLPNLTDKRFEIEYQDNVYLHKLIQIDLINISVKGHKRKFGRKTLIDYGRNWIFVIKHNDYAENRGKYAEVSAIIHDKIGGFLVKEYGYDPLGTKLIDGMNNVYINS